MRLWWDPFSSIEKTWGNYLKLSVNVQHISNYTDQQLLPNSPTYALLVDRPTIGKNEQSLRSSMSVPFIKEGMSCDTFETANRRRIRHGKTRTRPSMVCKEQSTTKNTTSYLTLLLRKIKQSSREFLLHFNNPLLVSRIMEATCRLTAPLTKIVLCSGFSPRSA